MKRALADVLWEAANQHLTEDLGRLETYSCNAAMKADGSFRLDAAGNLLGRENSAACAFLAQLGCDTHVAGFKDFREVERQGIRYMWLLLAACVAEDEGIEI